MPHMPQFQPYTIHASTSTFFQICLNFNLTPHVPQFQPYTTYASISTLRSICLNLRLLKHKLQFQPIPQIPDFSPYIAHAWVWTCTRTGYVSTATFYHIWHILDSPSPVSQSQLDLAFDHISRKLKTWPFVRLCHPYALYASFNQFCLNLLLNKCQSRP
jgi:hypothetical protein